ncbi:MAG: chromate transporter [Pyrinomonas sp.]|uniref:chromate efflux transporter n=1 Tax=Pyrinomonas sp. TaxID=2080306 RepID=UPI00332843C8
MSRTADRDRRVSSRAAAQGGTDAASPNEPKSRISFAAALRFWFKLGFISFGGPAGQIAIMHRELVERRRWIDEQSFLHALNYCMMLPGPEAQQLATYIDWLLHGTRGGLVAGAFFLLPSIFILLALSYIYAAYGHLPAVSSALYGLKAVVIAIVVEAVLRLGKRALHGGAHFVIAALSFFAIHLFRVPFPLIVLGAAVAGLLLLGKRNARREGDVPQGANPASTLVATNREDQAQGGGGRGHLVRTLGAGAALWIFPLALLGEWRGWASLHVAEYLFFSKAALVTFGGAYAALAYATQTVVSTYGWLSPTQAIDGLALAETTPGPLIMVLQFVGFMAAWNEPQDIGRTASAALGAAITTYVTFLPSFIFIFSGAPYIERLRRNRHLTDALSGITAAVVGVILNLALVFGTAVLWPRGFAAAPDWFALALSAATTVALVRFKAEAVWIVVADIVAGFARYLLESIF